MNKIGRNDPCPCGSGRKYKKCHGNSQKDEWRIISKEEAIAGQARRDGGSLEGAENRMRTINIVPLEAKSYTFRIGQPGKWHKVCKLMYSRDGSVMISFPYYRDSKGILSVCTHKVGETTASLREKGKVTSHRVKFVHHASGISHFSQTYKIWNTVRKKSCPLPLLIGHLATIKLQGLKEFEQDTDTRDPPPLSHKEQMLNIKLGGEDWEEKAYHLLFHYYDIKFLGTHFDGQQIGPTIHTTDPQGVARVGWLMTAPEKYKSHKMYFVLALVEEIPLLSAKEEPCLTFAGGFDTPEQKREKNGDSEFLSLIYPTTDFEQLKASIGTVDIEDSDVLSTQN